MVNGEWGTVNGERVTNEYPISNKECPTDEGKTEYKKHIIQEHGCSTKEA